MSSFGLLDYNAWYTSTIPTQPFTSNLPLAAPSYSTDFYGQNWASDPYGLTNPLSYSALSYPTSTFSSFPGYEPTLSSLPFGLQYPTLPSQGLDLPQLPSSRSHSPSFQDNLDSPYDEIANPYGMPSSPYDAPLPSSASRLRGRPTSPPRLPPRKSRYERERPSSPINDYQRHQSPPRNTTTFRSRSAERPREGYETSRGFLIPDETNHPVEQPIAPSAMRKWSHEDAAVLFRASRSGDLETLRSALESGYPINYVREQTGVTLFGKMKDTKGLMGKTITDVAGTDKVYSFLRNMGGKHAHELLARRRQKF